MEVEPSLMGVSDGDRVIRMGAVETAIESVESEESETAWSVVLGDALPGSALEEPGAVADGFVGPVEDCAGSWVVTARRKAARTRGRNERVREGRGILMATNLKGKQLCGADGVFGRLRKWEGSSLKTDSLPPNRPVRQ